MSNKQPHCSLSYHHYKFPDLETFSHGVSTGIYTHAVAFPSPPLTQAAFDALVETYHSTYEAYKNGGKDQKGDFMTAKTNLFAFWDGSDWDVVISADTTLTSDMFYNNLTINSTKILSPNGYKIFVKGTLTNNGTIRRNGNAGGAGGNASIGVVGAAGAAAAALNAGTLEDSVAGGAGGIGVTSTSQWTSWGAGTATNPSYTDTDWSTGWNGGDGNAGGANVPGGAGGASTRGALYNKVYSVEKLLAIISNPASSKITHLLSTTLYKGPWSGGGGGSGDAEWANCSGGGGWGGGAGGVIWIAAATLDNTNWVIESKGGAGGAAGTIYNSGASDVGGSGGGAGGNWGIIYLIYKTLTSIGTTTLTWWAGGALSVWSGGSGSSGSNGAAGSAGDLIQIQI